MKHSPTQLHDRPESRTSSRFRLICALITVLTASSAPLCADEREEFFESRIRPVLMKTCFTCHGGDKTSNGLRVDGRDHLIKGGKRGVAIVPGDPEDSLLLRAIRYQHPDVHMPPKERLAQSVINDFERWIARGAFWPEIAPNLDRESATHWAFQPVKPIDLDTLPGSSADHPIDRFIRAAQQKSQIQPLPRADRSTLIRRAYFDLIGLPPTPEQVRAFLEDDRPNAYESMIEELLNSPRYGERWGRYWLDLVRYADTAGDDSDYPIPQAVLYRDYVIDSLNSDKPYDEFIREQIAGDLLARQESKGEISEEEFRERVTATGFLAQAKRFATHKHEDMHLIIEDTLNTLGQSVLGLTLRCARCHDHKYDPTTQEDYYAMYGFFESIVYPHPGSEEEKRPSDLIPLIPDEKLARQEREFQEKFGRRIKELEEQIKKIEDETKDKRKRRELTAPLREELTRIRQQNPRETVPLAYAVREGKPVDAKLQIGGDPKRKTETVPRGFPKFLIPRGEVEIADQRSGRLELARWLTSPSNPLTARVMVNRIWQHHFGKAIVATPSNFGIQGEPPTHPELLDWLANRFVENSWSIKSMHRLIMLSETYQRASGYDEKNADLDPSNRTYWCFDRQRLDAESLRDSMLFLGGNLDLNRPGLHPFPPTDKWRYTAHHQFKAVYPSNHRSVYLMVQRLHPHPYLSLFNGPDTTSSVAVRDSSTVPLQALFIANSEFVHQQADGLTQQILNASEEGGDPIDTLYLMMFARPPSTAERDRAREYLTRYHQLLEEESTPPEERKAKAWASLARVLFASNEFVYID